MSDPSNAVVDPNPSEAFENQSDTKASNNISDKEESKPLQDVTNSSKKEAKFDGEQPPDHLPNTHNEPEKFRESNAASQSLVDQNNSNIAGPSEGGAGTTSIPVVATTTVGTAPTTAIATTTTLISNLEQQLQKSKRDLESMVLKYARSERENLQNKQKADELDKKLKRTIKDNDQLANRIKLLINDKNQLTDSLNAKVAQLTVLEQKNSYLNNVQGIKLKDYEEKIKKLEVKNEELLTLIDSYKSKEGELLDFSERLSMKHMMLQSELDEALKKVPNYKDQYEETLAERDELVVERDNLLEKIEFLSRELKTEQETNGKLRLKLDDNQQTHRADLDKFENEIKVMRRKHQIVSRELMKEIKQFKLRLEKIDPPSASISILGSSNEPPRAGDDNDALVR